MCRMETGDSSAATCSHQIYHIMHSGVEKYRGWLGRKYLTHDRSTEFGRSEGVKQAGSVGGGANRNAELGKLPRASQGKAESPPALHQ